MVALRCTTHPTLLEPLCPPTPPHPHPHPSALSIALLPTPPYRPTPPHPTRAAGGQWGRSAGGGGSDDEAGGGGGAPGAKPPKDYKEKGKATKPMGVEEFLDKGVGGALLPRKRRVLVSLGVEWVRIGRRRFWTWAWAARSCRERGACLFL